MYDFTSSQLHPCQLSCRPRLLCLSPLALMTDLPSSRRRELLASSAFLHGGFFIRNQTLNPHLNFHLLFLRAWGFQLILVSLLDTTTLILPIHPFSSRALS